MHLYARDDTERMYMDDAVMTVSFDPALPAQGGEGERRARYGGSQEGESERKEEEGGRRLSVGAAPYVTLTVVAHIPIIKDLYWPYSWSNSEIEWRNSAEWESQLAETTNTLPFDLGTDLFVTHLMTNRQDSQYEASLPSDESLPPPESMMFLEPEGDTMATVGTFSAQSE